MYDSPTMAGEQSITETVIKNFSLQAQISRQGVFHLCISVYLFLKLTARAFLYPISW